MPLLAVLSIKGSPGATRTAASLAALWPESDRVLVEADPAGGVLAARWRLQARPSLIDVAASLVTARDERDALEAGLQEATFLDNTVPVVCAPIHQSGATAALAKVIDQNPKVLCPPDRWVIADLGRITPSGWAWPLLSRADVVLVVVRGDVESTLALTGSAAPMAAECRARWAVAVVPAVYDADAVNGVLVAQDLQVPVLGDLPAPHPSRRGERRRAAEAWTDLAASCVALADHTPMAAITSGASESEK